MSRASPLGPPGQIVLDNLLRLRLILVEANTVFESPENVMAIAMARKCHSPVRFEITKLKVLCALPALATPNTRATTTAVTRIHLFRFMSSSFPKSCFQQDDE